jgi:hypothetical protein
MKLIFNKSKQTCVQALDDTSVDLDELFYVINLVYKTGNCVNQTKIDQMLLENKIHLPSHVGASVHVENAFVPIMQHYKPCGHTIPPSDC